MTPFSGFCIWDQIRLSDNDIEFVIKNDRCLNDEPFASLIVYENPAKSAISQDIIDLQMNTFSVSVQVETATFFETVLFLVVIWLGRPDDPVCYVGGGIVSPFGM